MGTCISPYYIRSKSPTLVNTHSGTRISQGGFSAIPVPCGKCCVCLKRRSNGWAFRLNQQDKLAQSAYFITLTYSAKHVPITKNGRLTLVKKDVQDFLKRLRINQQRNSKAGYTQPIKYYACGEYGPNGTRRPHYHIILFNADIQLIQKSWSKGKVHFGDVTKASVCYTLKYMHKSVKKEKVQNPQDDRAIEFQLSSQHLGKNYLTPEIIAWHKADLENRMYLPLPGNRKIGMPRYYKDKIYTKEEKARIVKYMIELAEVNLAEIFNKKGDQYYVEEQKKKDAMIARFEYQATLNRHL